MGISSNLLVEFSKVAFVHVRGFSLSREISFAAKDSFLSKHELRLIYPLEDFSFHRQGRCPDEMFPFEHRLTFASDGSIVARSDTPTV